LKGLALTIRSGGTGLNLTRAAHALHIDKDWTPGANQQAEDRICRIGSRGANYLYLTANHEMDKIVSEIVSAKEELIDTVIVETEDVGACTKAAINEIEQRISKLDEAAKLAAEAAKSSSKREDEWIAAGNGLRCPACGQYCAYRQAGPNAQNPGKWYVTCRGCDWFDWKK